MVEKEMIINKLKSEGISERLGNGLAFEDETALGSWVDAYKSGLPQQNKAITEYTKEELEEIMKDPQFKGAKGLQGLTDSLRQKYSQQQKQEPPKPSDPPKDDPRLEAMQKQLDEFFNKEANKAKQAQVDKWAREEAENQGVPIEFLEMATGKLTYESSKDDVVSEIKKAHAILNQMGVSMNGVPSIGIQPTNQKSKIGTGWARQQKERQRFNKK